MRPHAFVVIAGLALAIGLNAAPAQAQANRTFVSGHGSDTNPCSTAAPCRSFAFALTQTNAGGEITVLDSAGYGTVNITKAISINAPDGIEGGITTTTAVDAIAINAGASDVVNLRGLTLVGGGVGHDGIRFTSGKALNVQNCKIGGFTDDGIAASLNNNADISISDTIVTGNTVDGIGIFSGGTTKVTAVIKRVQASGNSRFGFNVDGRFGARPVSSAQRLRTASRATMGATESRSSQAGCR